MLNFRQVEAFRAVMLSRSMTQAAKDLHTTQPNVSRVIAQLEKRIGLRLFDRIAGKLVPTREGEVFFRDVERAFAGLRSLEQSAATLGRRGAGHLRVWAVPSLAMVLVPQAIRLFSTRYPDVTVSLQVAESNSVCQATASGHSDIGVASDVFNSPGIGYKIAHQATGVCIVPGRHRLARGTGTLKPADLAGEAFLSLSPQDAMRKTIDAIFEAEGDQRRLVYESHFAAAICQMVSLGLGVSIANSIVASDHKHLDMVVRRFSPEIVFPLYLVYQVGRPVSVLASAFSECFVEVAAKRK
jgi:DNA-binding transcriptional LysR family regulator